LKHETKKTEEEEEEEEDREQDCNSRLENTSHGKKKLGRNRGKWVPVTQRQMRAEV